jgi:Holliday junction resolvase RusA-like endonuclease
MKKINIKPLSVNQAWYGRKVRTSKHRDYEEEILYLLPKMKVPEGKLSVSYEFGLSSKNADGDNFIKIFQDILSKKYGFNDNTIYEWNIVKVNVNKGKEYIRFDIKEYDSK